MTGGSTRVQSRVKRLLGLVTAAMLAVGAVGCGTGTGEESTGSSEQGPSRWNSPSGGHQSYLKAHSRSS
jgi:hypothetical protein